MSGIYGFAASRVLPDCDVILDSMAQAIRPVVPSVEHRLMFDGFGGMGVIHPQSVETPVNWAEDTGSGMVCVCDGIVYTDADGNDIDSFRTSGAEVLLDGFLSVGPECLTRISGSYNVAWWDPRSNRLALGNDKLGQRLLFYVESGGKLAFSSLLAGIVAADIMSPQVDAEGLADLLYYGQILGERTLLEGFRILPPATILDFREGKASLHTYWHLDQVEQIGVCDECRLDELEALFKRAVRRCIPPNLTVSIGLTGGLDSRCVLAAAVSQGLSCVTHTGGQSESTDVVLAQRVASRAGVRHLFEPIGPERLHEWLVPMVYLQGGIVASLHSHPCRDIWHSREYAIAVPGVAGEPARAVWIFDPSFLEIRDRVEARQIFQRSQLSTRIASTPLFDEIWQPTHRSIGTSSPDRHLHDLMSEFTPRHPPAILWEYFLEREHVRKMLNKGIIIVRSSREVYLPYIDNEWVEAVAAIPISERKRVNMQIELIRRMSPELLRIPWEKDMIPMSASEWRVRWTKRIRRRVTGPPRKVPNSFYLEWSREEMAPFLTALLYDPSAAFRAYLRWDRVKSYLEAHFSGQENWIDLVGVLTVFEIAHRLWVEPKGFPMGISLDSLRC